MPSRLSSLDALRGFIMMVMALDHANAFIAHAHPSPEFWTGPFSSYSDSLAFLTRLVTHLAAPGFFFLMGAGITLFAQSRAAMGWSEGKIAQHFMVRGLILIAVQFLIENPAWQLGSILTGSGQLLPAYVGVLYGLGGCMIFAALLRRLPTVPLIITSAILLLLPEIVIRIFRPDLSGPEWLGLLLLPSFTDTITVYYPIIPWLGITGFGLLFGRALLADRERAYRWAGMAGGILLVAFFIIRGIGEFGNIRVFAATNWITFFNVVKYPPSLVFVCLTLGIDLLLLYLFSRTESFFRPLVVYGRSPLFFYVAHLYLYAIIGILFFPNGTEIARMYPVWLIGLAILYVLCHWYGRFKARQAPDSLWRFA
jgi:uncharacterized membrane protein